MPRMVSRLQKGTPRTAIVIEDDASEETPPGIPSARWLGSTGISVVVHAIAFLLLSLVLISQKETYEPLISEARFADESGDDGEFIVEVEDLDLPVTPVVMENIRALNAVTAVDSSIAFREVDVDLNAFGNRLSGSDLQGLPSGIAAIAGEVQGRVAKAGGRTGEVQFSLAWESLNDLDLHVITPSGEHIAYSNRDSQCHGELDVDMNAGTRRGPDDKSFSEHPVENVRWLSRKAPSGRFTVLVHQFRWRRDKPSDEFKLVVKLGSQIQVVEGTVTVGDSISIHRFQYARDSLSPGRQKQLLKQLVSLQEREEKEATKKLDKARELPPGISKDQQMRSIIGTFPHTDAAIRAMQELEGDDKL